jgi:two-component system response regulator FixJ
LQLLTAREVDVLKLIVTAKSSRETATDLGISPRTVEVHRRRIMRKMQARNIADLVRIIASLD